MAALRPTAQGPRRAEFAANGAKRPRQTDIPFSQYYVGPPRWGRNPPQTHPHVLLYTSTDEALILCIPSQNMPPENCRPAFAAAGTTPPSSRVLALALALSKKAQCAPHDLVEPENIEQVEGNV